jgi:hypothetical protein
VWEPVLDVWKPTILVQTTENTKNAENSSLSSSNIFNAVFNCFGFNLNPIYDKNYDIEVLNMPGYLGCNKTQQGRDMIKSMSKYQLHWPMTLSEYFDTYKDTNIKSWKSKDYIALIFQIIHTLAVIQNKYPNFRHNNLNIKHMDGYIKNVSSSTSTYCISSPKIR